LREARKAREIAESIEECIIDSIKDLMVNPPVPEELEDKPEVVYRDSDGNSEDSDYESGTDSGENEVVDSDWWGKNDHQTGKTGPERHPSRHIHPDEDLWEEQLLDTDIVLQDTLYFNIVMNSPTDLPPPPPRTSIPDTLPAGLPIFTQTDTSVEVDTGRGNKHPSGMVNCLGENNVKVAATQ